MRKLVLTIFVFIILNVQLFAQDNKNVLNENKNTESSITTESFISYSTEKLLRNGIIVFEITVLLMVLFYWKKTRNNVKRQFDQSYKKNIQALRNEKFTFVNDKVRSKKRKSLKKVMKSFVMDSANISKKARELNIGKGEIFLAAKIQKLYQQSR
ncbi:MAG: hypothetical protein IPH62_03970 [Ignavibacteriae bacterium]|nr:hypothetical protein [Ignavibacteriota bacterium]